MIPVVTPEEMGDIDRAAPEPVGVLIGRAGAAVAWEATAMLGGTYGRRVVVVAGKGNNGNDGRDAAVRLRQRGVRVTMIDAAALPARLPEADLVVDAAYGTGFRGDYVAPDAAGAPVLAVDIPSGVDGLTGAAGAGSVAADRTVTFAALKPGLLFHPGRGQAGEVRVVDIGLDVSGATVHTVEPDDVASWLPPRPALSHKWKAAVWVIAGSPGMSGAAALATRAAQRAGAGYVRLTSPGALPRDSRAALEVVVHPATAIDWSEDVLAGAWRVHATVIGPGLGSDVSVADVRRAVAGLGMPTVVDGDGLTALGRDVAQYTGASTILTPHDGEFERLTGAPPGPDRIAAARALASETGAVVLLKGPTTVVADPHGAVLLSTAGDARLATAGTGDVLSGVIAALCARGLDPFRAAAAGAFLHGRAGNLGWPRSLVAGDLPDLVATVIADLEQVWPETTEAPPSAT